MRYRDIAKIELKESDGATCAASVATVAMPFFMGSAPEPTTPKKKKQAKKPLVLKRT
jgi:hypothetical protein